MRIELDHIGHRYSDGPWLFHDLNATLIPGHVYALTGPSGSGKSTLLGILAGWIRPANGNVIAQNVISMRWVFQNPYGTPQRTVLDHVVLPLLARGLTRAQAEHEAIPLLRRFGLEGLRNHRFSELSGGEAQRLMLARAVISHPSLMLVDEPTAQLDIRTAATVSDALARIAQFDTIVVVATHDSRTRDACTDIINLEFFQ